MARRTRRAAAIAASRRVGRQKEKSERCDAKRDRGQDVPGWNGHMPLLLNFANPGASGRPHLACSGKAHRKNSIFPCAAWARALRESTRTRTQVTALKINDGG